ncbi:hypothetical protein VTK56DRAFT_6640 [Thermocarpiscus australiensis]
MTSPGAVADPPDHQRPTWVRQLRPAAANGPTRVTWETATARTIVQSFGDEASGDLHRTRRMEGGMTEQVCREGAQPEVWSSSFPSCLANSKLLSFPSCRLARLNLIPYLLCKVPCALYMQTAREQGGRAFRTVTACNGRYWIPASGWLRDIAGFLPQVPHTNRVLASPNRGHPTCLLCQPLGIRAASLLPLRPARASC